MKRSIPLFSRPFAALAALALAAALTLPGPVLSQTAPSVSFAVVKGSTLTLGYNARLDPNSVPATGDFMVTVAGSTRGVNSVSVSGMEVTLTLASPVTSGQTVTVSYTKSATNPIRGVDGVEAGDLSNQKVTRPAPEGCYWRRTTFPGTDFPDRFDLICHDDNQDDETPGDGNGGGGGGGNGGGGFEEAPPSASDLFTDVPAGTRYENAVTWMVQNDITRGCTPTTFCPDQDLTRQQFVTFLWRAAGEPTPDHTGSETFSDVPADAYSNQAIGWAVGEGITLGCTSGTRGDGSWQFCPTNQVTRGEMATFLYRKVEADYIGQTPSYTDVEADAFYTPGIAWLTDFQVVLGCDVNRFCPNQAATRAEAATFINGVAIRPHIWGTGNTNFLPQSQ